VLFANNAIPFSLVSTSPPSSVFSDRNQSDYSERVGGKGRRKESEDRKALEMNSNRFR